MRTYLGRIKRLVIHYPHDTTWCFSDFDADTKPDMNTDIGAATDRHERVSMMEPLRISGGILAPAALADLSVELAAHSAGFRRSLPEGVLAALADLVRASCYYGVNDRPYGANPGSP